MTLEAFHNDKKIKIKYLKRVADHRKADELIQGASGANGKGCAVWCTLDKYHHKSYETELGIPEWLARVEDVIFEGLNKKRSQKWPEQFLKAINLGADLSKVEAPFTIFVLKSNLNNFDTEKYPDIKAAIERCIELYEIGDLEPSAAWSAAESAAWSAAESAAWSAARSAAESAAWSAARSAAESAAWSAARSAAFEKFADKLLELLKACK
jgi:hypothetical protein